MKNPTKNRNIGIDLLRGASILYIVGFWHMLDYTKFNPFCRNPITLRLTYIILGTFIFISGYFIGLEKITISKQSMMQFYKKKLIRIYPLYLIAIWLFTIYHYSDLITSIKAACFISMFIKPAPLTLWFITMLMLFYIISPFIVVASQRIKISKLILYYSTFIILLLVYAYFTKLLDTRFIMYFPSFAFGVLVANTSKKFFQKKYILFILIVISIYVSFLKTPCVILNEVMPTPLVVICSYLLFIMVKEFVVSSNLLYNLIILLSYSSYCMYLFHRPIYTYFRKIYFPETYLIQIIYLVIFCLPCIIFYSYIIQKVYDVTITTLANRFSERKKAIPFI